MLSNTWALQCEGQDRRSASHFYVSMMMSSNGNIFRVTGPLWGESTGHKGIPPTKASDEVSICEQPSEFTARHREFNCLTQIRPDMSKLCLNEYFGEKRLCHKGVQLHQCDHRRYAIENRRHDANFVVTGANGKHKVGIMASLRFSVYLYTAAKAIVATTASRVGVTKPIFFVPLFSQSLRTI